MHTSLRQQIITLLRKGKTYNQICTKLKCANSTIAYHSKKSGIKSIHKVEPISKELKNKLKDFYKTHTIVETTKKFKVSKPTIIRYCPNKRILLTPEERQRRQYLYIKQHRARKKEWAVKYKGGKCKLCGYSKNICALDFHHLDKNKKKFNIAGTRYYLSIKALKKELDKCILVCANCHRELHNT
jgi:hypothetical protein